MRNCTLVAAVALALSFTGCPAKTGPASKTEPVKEEPKATQEPVKKEEPKVEAKKEEPKAEAKKEEPKAEPEAKKEEPKAEPEAKKAEGAGGPEENCGALYDFTKQLAEAFAKKAGKGATKDLPAREKFIEACKELPPEVSRCMNPQVAMKEGPKCQETLKNVDKAKLEKFKRMLGGK